MGMTVRYEPPKGDFPAMLSAAAELGVEAGGKVLLDASLPLVPVDTGQMKASGKAEKVAAKTVRVSYERTGTDGYNVAVRQHEDLALHHTVGEAKFLEKPIHSEAPAILTAMAEPIRAIFG